MTTEHGGEEFIESCLKRIYEQDAFLAIIIKKQVQAKKSSHNRCILWMHDWNIWMKSWHLSIYLSFLDANLPHAHECRFSVHWEWIQKYVSRAPGRLPHPLVGYSTHLALAQDESCSSLCWPDAPPAAPWDCLLQRSGEILAWSIPGLKAGLDSQALTHLPLLCRDYAYAVRYIWQSFHGLPGLGESQLADLANLYEHVYSNFIKGYWLLKLSQKWIVQH